MHRTMVGNSFSATILKRHYHVQIFNVYSLIVQDLSHWIVLWKHAKVEEAQATWWVLLVLTLLAGFFVRGRQWGSPIFFAWTGGNPAYSSFPHVAFLLDNQG